MCIFYRSRFYSHQPYTLFRHQKDIGAPAANNMKKEEDTSYSTKTKTY